MKTDLRERIRQQGIFLNKFYSVDHQVDCYPRLLVCYFFNPFVLLY
jgi:hypothetical protein